MDRQPRGGWNIVVHQITPWHGDKHPRRTSKNDGVPTVPTAHPNVAGLVRMRGIESSQSDLRAPRNVAIRTEVRIDVVSEPSAKTLRKDA